jgi:ribosomal protein S24E
LVPIDSFAEGSHTPTSKSVIVSLVKATQVQATQVQVTQAKATVGN